MLFVLGGNGEELDIEIFEIFIEEVEEFIEGIDNMINVWLVDCDN